MPVTIELFHFQFYPIQYENAMCQCARGLVGGGAHAF